MIDKTPAWKAIAAKKRAAQLASIPQQWHLPDEILQAPPTNTFEFLERTKLLSDREKFLTNQEVSSLLQLIASKKATAVEVVTAFFKRVSFAQQLIKCCTEMFFNEAVAQAQALDEYLEKKGEVNGPLHGLPVCLKDQYSIKGQDTTIGWVGFIGKPATRDSELVQCLRSQGAVLYVKSNIPQSLMMSDSYNHVFKQSVNGLNRALISGGSSGGEAAITCVRASPVGIGTDIGGSIRIPAALQGMYGLCPTVGRVCLETSRARRQILSSVAGPISWSLSSVEAFLKGYLASQPWNLDPGIIPIPWRAELCAPPSRPLRIGFYFDDGFMRVQPPAERAIKEVVAKLAAAGHEVFEWETSSHAKGHDMWSKGMLSDGGDRFQELCDLVGEPLIQGMIVGTPAGRLTHKEACDVCLNSILFILIN
jgi:amidase